MMSPAMIAVIMTVSVTTLGAPLRTILGTPSLAKGLFLSIVEDFPTLAATHAMGTHPAQLMLILETILAAIHTPVLAKMPKMLELGVAMVNNLAKRPMSLATAFAILHLNVMHEDVFVFFATTALALHQ